MSFFKSLKRAFGVSVSEEEVDVNDSIIGQPLERPPYINPFKKEVMSENAGNDSDLGTTNVLEVAEPPIVLPDPVLNGVIDIVNASLPEFIRKCVDVEAEKKFLYESIGASFEVYANTLKEEAIKKHTEKWSSERKLLEQKINSMQNSVHEAELKGEEFKNQQLSIERQKRALSDRIHDLEAINQKNEAEIEQYMLENKSLLNKLKVSQVKSDDIEFFKSENARLKSRLNEKGNLSVTVEELEQTIKLLQKEKEELAHVDYKNIQNESELELNTAMINEMRSRIAIQSQEIEIKATELNEFKEKLKLTTDELEGVREELNEANLNLEVVQEVQEQLNNVEELKRRKDAKIRALTESLKSRDLENNELHQNVAFLNKTIEDNMINHATILREVTSSKNIAPKKTIDKEVFDMTMLEDVSITRDSSPKYNTKEHPIQNISTSINNNIEEQKVNNISFDVGLVVSAIDDSIDNDNWLRHTPPSQIVEKKEVDLKNSEEISSKVNIHTIDTTQMSLF